TLFRLRDGRREADLIFTSFGHERLNVDAKESDQALFEYSIGPDPRDGSKRDLFRRVKPLLDEEPERGGEKAVLAEGVVAFSIEAWEPKDREWRAEWNSNGADRTGGLLLPPRVRLTLNSRDELRAYYLARSAVNLSRLLLHFQKQVDQLGGQLGPVLSSVLAGQAPRTGTGGVPQAPAAAPASNLGIRLWEILPIDSNAM